MTDEQRMRERFEADCLHIDEGQVARTKAGDYAIEWVDGTWIGYAIAYKARDAEVQQLRQALTEVTNELEAEVNHRYGFDPATGEVKGLARRYEVDISVVRMARAVLAGEEATDE